MAALAAGTVLTYVGKISGETISGFVGVIIGYVLSKENFRLTQRCDKGYWRG